MLDAMTADSILDTIGGTPLIQLKKISGDGPEILGKLEAGNPTGSVKDRIGLSMIRAAESTGALRKGMTIVEPTSGNTGIALAMAAAALGYRLILTMPTSMSVERRSVMASYGAEIELTPAVDDMPGAIERAEEIKARDPVSVYMPQQFSNPANPQAHRDATGPEILAATGGELDAFVVGVGTGGTISGAGKLLKTEIPQLRIVAVEPAQSPVLAGGKPGLHGIQGIGAGFIPEVMDLDLVDEIIAVEDKEAFSTMRRLAREEGILVGPSAGANVAAALRCGTEKPDVSRIVTLLCDTGFRYFSVDGFGGT